MIGRQAGALRQVARLDVARQASLLRDAATVHVVGTGTSQHAAELGVALLEPLGIDARSAAAASAARWRRPPRRGDAVIVISHTGETAYARQVRQQALAAGLPLVSITGPDAGWPEAIVTPVREQAETYTVSYTTAIGVLAMLAHHLGAVGTGPDALAAVADRVGAILDDPGIGHIDPPERAMALVGAGPWHVTAREAALKLREGAHVLADGFDAELLLHGSAVPYRRGDLLVALQPGADPDGLVAAVAAAAPAEGIDVATVEEDEMPASPVLAQIPLTVRLQLLAARFAEELGTDPDVVITGAWADQRLWQLGAPASG
jgi:glucosamine--fructose-6-phosphate aminotransferase (isomerizing)